MKRLIYCMLAAVICMSASACGKDGKKNSSGETAANASGNKEAAAETTEAAEAFLVPAKEEFYLLPYNVVDETDLYRYYVNADDTAIFYGYRGEEETLVIPDEIEGHKVTALNHKAFSSSNVKEVTIPAGITVIYGNPFNECKTIESIKVAEGNTAFRVQNNCLIRNEDNTLVCSAGISDETCEIPDGVVRIGDWSFADNYSFQKIIMPDSVTEVDEYAFIRSGVGSAVFSKNLQKIGKYGFAYCYFSEIELPEGLVSIGEMAFSGNIAETINLPDSVESLGKNAFNDSRNLKTVKMPASIKEIEGNPFSACPALAQITIPSGCETVEVAGSCLINKAEHILICNLAGEGTSEVVVPNGVETIAEGAFQGQNSVTKVTLPEGLKVIGDRAFEDCGGLVQINFPDGLTTIGADAFSDNESLTGLTLPESLETIGSSAFYWCKALTEVNIPGAVKTIGRYTFSNCSSLTKAAIGEGVETIEDGAFSSCSVLADVTLPGTLVTIGKDAFEYSSAKSVTIPASVTEIGSDAFDRIEEIDLGVYKGSYGEEYCKKYQITYHTVD